VAAGFEVTHDWTGDIEAARDRGLSDADLDDLERKMHVNRDLNGVLTADIFWLLAPPEPRHSIGCWNELGAALAACIINGTPRVYISGGNQDPLFCGGADHRFPLDYLAFEALQRLERGARQKGLVRGV
jgi:hypothetical protein